MGERAGKGTRKHIFRTHLSPTRRKRLSRLYPECRPEEKAAEQDARRLRMAAIGLAAGGILAVAALLVGRAPEVQTLERPSPGAGSRTEELQIEQNGQAGRVELELSERRMTEAEREERLDQAEAEMRRIFLGENPDADHVSLPLALSAECPVDGVTAWWNPEETDLVHPDGTLSEEAFGADGRETVLELNLSDGESERVVPVTIRLVDHALSDGENDPLEKALKTAVEEHPEETAVVLPGEIAGQPVTYRRGSDMPIFRAVQLKSLTIPSRFPHIRSLQQPHMQTLLPPHFPPPEMQAILPQFQ